MNIVRLIPYYTVLVPILIVVKIIVAIPYFAITSFITNWEDKHDRDVTLREWRRYFTHLI